TRAGVSRNPSRCGSSPITRSSGSTARPPCSAGASTRSRVLSRESIRVLRLVRVRRRDLVTTDTQNQTRLRLVWLQPPDLNSGKQQAEADDPRPRGDIARDVDYAEVRK